jgi:hypothetical protein
MAKTLAIESSALINEIYLEVFLKANAIDCKFIKSVYKLNFMQIYFSTESQSQLFFIAMQF